MAQPLPTEFTCSYCGKKFSDEPGSPGSGANKAQPLNHGCPDYDPRIASIR